MKLNLKNSWVLLLAVFLVITSYTLGMCGVSESCEWYETFYSLSFPLFEPILIYSIAVLPLALVLLFVRDELFSRWLRFARWWIPLSIVLIALAPTSSNTWMPFIWDPTKEGLSWLMGAVLTIASIVLFVRARKRKRS